MVSGLRKLVPATGAQVADQPAAIWSNRRPVTEMDESRMGSWSEKKAGWGLHPPPGGWAVHWARRGMGTQPSIRQVQVRRIVTWVVVIAKERSKAMTSVGQECAISSIWVG